MQSVPCTVSLKGRGATWPWGAETSVPSALVTSVTGSNEQGSPGAFVAKATVEATARNADDQCVLAQHAIPFAAERAIYASPARSPKRCGCLATSSLDRTSLR